MSENLGEWCFVTGYTPESPVRIIGSQHKYWLPWVAKVKPEQKERKPRTRRKQDE